MTLDRLAYFAESDSGKVYRDVCERYGVDPAAVLEDDVLAYQLRVALAIAHPAEQVDESPDPFAEARAAGAKVKAMGA